MKVVVCPSDTGGCGHYRMIWPAEALASQGKDVVLQRRPKIMVNQATNPKQVLDVELPPHTKVIVFQRPGSYQISQLIPILHKKGIKVVIDMDDDLASIHPSNPAYQIYDPKLNPHRNWEWVQRACDMADVITATTESLLELYASKTKGILIPNCVPEKFLNIEKKPNELVTVGWAGWVRTHPEDLQVTHGAINEALVRQNARFLAIGDLDTFRKLQVRNRYPNEFHEGVKLQEYPEAVAQLDIGIVPLADTRFNRSKSWIKALEYASLGVAPVVSPTPDNMRLVKEGGAYVAQTPKAWRDVVRTLIQNEEERYDLVRRAKAVASNWTVEGNAHRWWEAWTGV